MSVVNTLPEVMTNSVNKRKAIDIQIIVKWQEVASTAKQVQIIQCQIVLTQPSHSLKVNKIN